MKQIKFMTNAQIKRIQENNYCSEHDRNGKQFDYEAKGYRYEINAMILERNQKYIANMIKQANNKAFNEYQSQLIQSVRALDKKPSNDLLGSEIASETLKIAVLKAFRPWRNISNEIMMKMN